MKYKHILKIEAKEWFDRINGNSYFSARVYLDDKLVTVLPFQYGYGSHFEDMANQELSQKGIFDNPEKGPNQLRKSLWRYCEENEIKLITNKQEKCLKREVVSFGK